MRSVLTLFTMLCLFFGICQLIGECPDAGVVSDACHSEIRAIAEGQTSGDTLFAVLDVESSKAEPATRTGLLLLCVQRPACQGYFSALRSCGELLSNRLASLAHRQMTDRNSRIIYHLCQPVCAYYVYALRHILI